MKKIIFSTLILLILSVGNCFAAYVEVSPSQNFDWVYFQWDRNGNGNFDDGDIGSLNTYSDGSTGDYYYAFKAGQTNLTFKDKKDGDYLFKTIGFCIDLTTVEGDGEATLKNITTDRLAKAAWLFDQYAGQWNSSDKNAGLQLAIWDVLYSGGGDPTTDNLFKVLNYQGVFDYYSWYKTYIDSLSSIPGNFDISMFKRVDFDDPSLQDMLTTVPLPSSLLLFGLGLLGLSSLRRKRE